MPAGGNRHAPDGRCGLNWIQYSTVFGRGSIKAEAGAMRRLRGAQQRMVLVFFRTPLFLAWLSKAARNTSVIRSALEKSVYGFVAGSSQILACAIVLWLKKAAIRGRQAAFLRFIHPYFTFLLFALDNRAIQLTQKRDRWSGGWYKNCIFFGYVSPADQRRIQHAVLFEALSGQTQHRISVPCAGL